MLLSTHNTLEVILADIEIRKENKKLYILILLVSSSVYKLKYIILSHYQNRPIEGSVSVLKK